MTTPNAHNEVYLDAVHRQFLGSYLLDKVSDPKLCAGPENHDTAAMGGFTSIAPIVIANLCKGMGAARAQAKEHMRLLENLQG